MALEEKELELLCSEFHRSPKPYLPLTKCGDENCYESYTVLFEWGFVGLQLGLGPRSTFTREVACVLGSYGGY